MFITNNRVSLHLWCKENLLKHQNVSKSHDCMQNFLLLSMSLLTAPIVENAYTLTETYFIFLKKRPRPNLKFRPQ